MVLDALLVVVVFVCLFVCFVIACHCKITAYVGDNKLILILSFYEELPWPAVLKLVDICFGCECSQVFMDMTKKWQTGAELSASFTVEVGDLDEAGQLPCLCQPLLVAFSVESIVRTKF